MLTANRVPGKSLPIMSNERHFVVWYFRADGASGELYAVFDPSTWVQVTRLRWSPFGAGILPVVGEVEWAHKHYPPSAVLYEPGSVGETPYIEGSIGASGPTRGWRRLFDPIRLRRTRKF